MGTQEFQPGLYSVGYADLALPQLDALVARVDELLDVRSNPISRKRGYSRKALEVRYPEQYVWKGEDLGGRQPVSKEGLDWLSRECQAGKRVLMLCLEDLAQHCHRHRAIAVRLLRAPYHQDTWHLWQSTAMRASDLDRLLREIAEQGWDANRDERALDVLLDGPWVEQAALLEGTRTFRIRPPKGIGRRPGR